MWTNWGRDELELKLESHRENLELLDNMDYQRMAAVGQVHSALLRLTRFDYDMSILDEKIADAMEDGLPPDWSNVVKTPDAAGGERFESYTLMGHIEQIDLATKKLKNRSLLVDEAMKARTEKAERQDHY